MSTAEEIEIHNVQLREALRVCCFATLMEPMAGAFNDLMIVDAVKRVQMVAAAVNDACQKNETLMVAVKEKNVIRTLWAEAKLRQSGEVVSPKAVLPDLVRVSREVVTNV